MIFQVMKDAEALREHLDELNDGGIGTNAVGVDANEQPFLIELTGPYAEGEVVFFHSPWDRERDMGTEPPYCDECQAFAPYGMEHLKFPVHVVTR